MYNIYLEHEFNSTINKEYEEKKYSDQGRHRRLHETDYRFFFLSIFSYGYQKPKSNIIATINLKGNRADFPLLSATVDCMYSPHYTHSCPNILLILNK